MTMGLAALAALAAPEAAQADGLEPGFDFESLKLRFEREDAQRRADGMVLQQVRDPKGNVKGRLSFGGSGRAEDPYEGTAAAVNFRGRNEEELGSGLLNLRLSF